MLSNGPYFVVFSLSCCGPLLALECCAFKWIFSLMFSMIDTLCSLLLTKPACCEFCYVLIRVQFQKHFDRLFACPQENGDIAADDGLHRGVQYPFAVNEKVVIKVRFSILFPCILFMAVVNGIACMKH